MSQLITRIDDKLISEIDDLVKAGIVATRSDAVRQGLQQFIDQHRRRRVGAKIAEAYRQQPQTEEELAGIDESTRALIEEDPW